MNFRTHKQYVYTSLYKQLNICFNCLIFWRVPEFEAFLFMGGFMRPIKFFNFALPYETYQELKRISIESEKPIAEIVRQGIGLVLKKPSCPCGGAINGK